jgi:hypothetical protein
MDRLRRLALKEQLIQAAAEVGGELLQGSGFEGETPDPEFSESAPDAVAPRQ